MVDWAAALAGGLQARGVGAGDVVGLLSYNSLEFLATIFAANHLGAIAMPINWRLAAPELRYILEHSEARALVCDEALVDLADEATAGLDGRPRAGVRLGARRRRAGSASPTWPTAPSDPPGSRSRATTSTASCTRRGRPAGRRA